MPTAGLLLPVALAFTAPPPRAALDRPNVVMLFVDDLGYGDVGFNGHPTTNTPNIDKLAWNGKVLTTWYSGCPVCSCSRASLMTGRQWSRMGIPGVFGPTVDSGLPLNETTVADQLSAAGYATGAAGKWHLGQREAYLPAARGFDEYLGIPYSDDMGEARATPCDSSGMRKPPGGGGGAQTTPTEEVLAPYVAAGLAPSPGAAEKSDPAGNFLPLVSHAAPRSSIPRLGQTRPLDAGYIDSAQPAAQLTRVCAPRRNTGRRRTRATAPSTRRSSSSRSTFRGSRRGTHRLFGARSLAL